jgi:hypothetical protein
MKFTVLISLLFLAGCAGPDLSETPHCECSFDITVLQRRVDYLTRENQDLRADMNDSFRKVWAFIPADPEKLHNPSKPSFRRD